MSVPRSLDSRDPWGNLALRPSRGREEEEHRVPTGRGPRADCPASGAGRGAAATHANSPRSAGRGFPLLQRSSTRSFSTFSSSINKMIPHAIKYFEVNFYFNKSDKNILEK